MKHILLPALFIVMLLLIFSCSKELSIDSSSAARKTFATYDVPYQGGIITIPVKSNVEYSSSVRAGDSFWLKSSDTKASTVKSHSFTALENTTHKKRQGQITFQSDNGKLRDTVLVNQLPDPWTISVTYAGKITQMPDTHISGSDLQETVNGNIYTVSTYTKVSLVTFSSIEGVSVMDFSKL